MFSLTEKPLARKYYSKAKKSRRMPYSYIAISATVCISMCYGQIVKPWITAIYMLYYINLTFNTLHICPMVDFRTIRVGYLVSHHHRPGYMVAYMVISDKPVDTCLDQGLTHLRVDS